MAQFYPQWTAGEDATADKLNSMLPLMAWKTATEGVTSSTVMQNDDELFLTVEANATYIMDLFLLHDSATAADITIGWSGPASATLNWGMVGAHVNETSSGTVTAVTMQSRIISETQDLGGGASTGTACFVKGTLVTAGTAGTLRFQWAQRVSNATATNVRAGSYLTLKRVA